MALLTVMDGVLVSEIAERGISKAELDEIVETNDKKRFEYSSENSS